MNAAVIVAAGRGTRIEGSLPQRRHQPAPRPAAAPSRPDAGAPALIVDTSGGETREVVSPATLG